MKVAGLLREARRRAGLTQHELARRAGTTQSAISAYETGASSPSVATLQRLLAATGHDLELGVSPRPTTADLTGPVGQLVRERRRQIRHVLGRYGATGLRVFGSVARGEDTDDSDVDLLVDVPETTTLVDLAGLLLDLRELLGREVDVLTPGALDGEFRERVLAEAVPL